MNLKPRPLALAILAAFSSAALADYNVTVAPGASANGAWSGGSPDVWTPSATGASVSVSEINTRLAAGTPVSVTTAGGGAETGNLLITRLISWSSNTTLALTAANNIEFAAALTATGNSAGLVLTPGGGGDYILSGGRITLSGSAPSLTIAGNAYTVINSVGVAGDATATTLQGMKNALAGRYALGSDIDASGTSGWNAGTGFLPVGTFTGTFAGLGHVVSGLTINRPGTDNVGLFATSTGTIREVGISGGSVSGNNSVGALVGVNNSGTVRASNSTASVTGAASWIGGLVGQSSTSSVVSNNYASGNVTGGDKVGGFWGSGDGFDHAYSKGNVAATTNGGGLAGEVTGTASASYWDTQTSNQGTSAGGTGKLAAEMKQKVTYVGWDFDKVWRIDENNGYPFLRWESYLPILSAVGVSGTSGTATTLAATSDLYGDGYWIVVARDATAPTAAQVKAAATYSGVTLAAGGNAAMTTNAAKNFSVSGLTGGTSYDLYFAAEDGSGNLVAAPVKVQFSTTEVVPPAFQSAAINAGLTVATLTFDEAPVNNLANIDPLLKANVTFASDGTTFSALAAGDVVAIAGSTVTVTFASALTGTTNKLKIAANSLKDAAGNVLASAVTTAALDATDTAPNAFSFTAATNAALSTATESAAITVTGINAAANISISGGQYAVSTDSGGSWGAYTAGAGTVNLNDQVKVKLTSSNSYSTAAIATLTIGGENGTFSVTTLAASAPAPSYDPGQYIPPAPTVINAQAGGETTLTGATPVNAAPGSTLVIPAGASVSGVAITLAAPAAGAAAQPVTIKIGGNTLTVTPTGANVVVTLKTVTLNGVPTLVLAVSSGAATVSAAPGQPLLTLGNSGVVITAGAEGGAVAFDASRATSLSVTGGYVVLPANAFATINHFAEIKDGKLYAGEIAQLDVDGKVAKVRLGSLTGSAVGDPLKTPVAAGLTLNATLPNLKGKAARLSATQDFAEILAAALGATSKGQNSNGVPGLTTPSGSANALAVGDIGVDTSRADGITISGNGRKEVVKGGVIVNLVPAVGDPAQLAAQVTRLDKNAAITVNDYGVIRASLNGATYAVQPGWAVDADGGAAGFGVDALGNVEYRDGSGNRQTLYPVFIDLGQIIAAFKPTDANVAATGNADDTITAKYLGATYTLMPDYLVLPLPSVHAKDAWWLDGAKVYVRNSDGKTAQGFGVK